jgi:AcrR family transcriptional regulator
MQGNRPPRPQYAEGRDALLDAAARVVARDGFGGLTYRAVAREAGTTHGLVSYHFGSRDKLIHETVAKARREAIDASSLAPESERLEDFASDLAELAQEAPEAQVFQFELALEARRREELGPEVRALYDEYLAVTTRALASFEIDADPALVRLVFAALDGLTLQQLIYERPEETEASVAALQRLLHGLARTEPAGDS